MSGAREMFTANPTPFVVVDSQGRELAIRELTALDRLRLFKAVGPTLSQNTAYLGMAMLAVSVSAIAGVPVPSPANEAQIEATIAKLGDDGIAAVANALAQAAELEMDSASAGN